MLLDTNVLITLLQPHHPWYAAADRAIQRLPFQGKILHIVPQNLIELWAVATRPFASNGLGMTTSEARRELVRLQSLFPLLPETSDIFPVWESLVVRLEVSVKPTHDARLVAAMHVHGLTSILTFEKTGFSRYTGIAVVHPVEIG